MKVMIIFMIYWKISFRCGFSIQKVPTMGVWCRKLGSIMKFIVHYIPLSIETRISIAKPIANAQHQIVGLFKIAQVITNMDEWTAGYFYFEC